MSDSLNPNSDFSHLLETLVATHGTLQQQAARSVDTALVARNWLFIYGARYVSQGSQYMQRRAASFTRA